MCFLFINTCLFKIHLLVNRSYILYIFDLYLLALKDMKKRCSNLFIVREMPIKITLSYYFSSIRLAKIQKFDNSWQGCEKIGTLIYCS